MLRRAGLNILEVLHISVAGVYAVLAVVLNTVLVQVGTALLLPFLYLCKAVGYEDFIRRHPMPLLIFSIPVVAYFAAQGHFPFGTDILHIVAGSVVWLFFLYTALMANFVAAAFPSQVDQFEATIASRWPERWYARHMKKPINAIYLRRVITNSLVLIPAGLAMILPGELSAYSVIFFALGFAFTGTAQETTDHSDMHNNLFARRHLPRGGARLVFWLTNKYLRLVLNVFSLRPPHFYRAQHLYIHHVENNGVRDTQTTVLHDRTSFFDFCRYCLRLALSWTFAVDVYAYLRRKRNLRQCRLLLVGMLAWYGVLVLIALHNPAAAVFFFVYRFLSGVVLAQNINFWHALADPDYPEDLYKNSLNLVPDLPVTAGMAEMHVLHHERSSAHFVRVINFADEQHQRWQAAGALSFSIAAAEPVIFTKALLARRFDVLADLAAMGEGITREELLRVIQHRTRAVSEKKRGDLYHRLDRRCANWWATYLMPGKLAPPETRSDDKPAAPIW